MGPYWIILILPIRRLSLKTGRKQRLHHGCLFRSGVLEHFLNKLINIQHFSITKILTHYIQKKNRNFLCCLVYLNWENNSHSGLDINIFSIQSWMSLNIRRHQCRCIHISRKLTSSALNRSPTSLSPSPLTTNRKRYKGAQNALRHWKVYSDPSKSIGYVDRRTKF